jgi:hypothetical protein
MAQTALETEARYGFIEKTKPESATRIATTFRGSVPNIELTEETYRGEPLFAKVGRATYVRYVIEPHPQGGEDLLLHWEVVSEEEFNAAVTASQVLEVFSQEAA